MEKINFENHIYLEILEKELVPAMGCTEPIALAYCGALARELLAKEWPQIDRVKIVVSSNIIKNVKSVVVPNTRGRRGIEAAAAIGIIGGKAEWELEVISQIEGSHKESLAEFLQEKHITVEPSKEDIVLNIMVTLEGEGESATVQICHEHTNLVYKEKNGEILLDKRSEECKEDDLDYSKLNTKDIFEFAEKVDLKLVEPIIQRQIDCNTKISEEGLKNPYGANIGKVLILSAGENIGIKTKAKAAAAAASDARMNGCELPVVINSGSGNQGATTSLPVIEYAKHFGSTNEQLIRALVLSNLITIYQKSFIGRLSAFCGVVSAGAGAAAGITYLDGGDYEQVIHSIVNTLAIASGMVCDGAKSSCAAKIATAVEAGILGYEMYKNGQQFYGGEGVIAKGVENTIKNIGELGKVGMYETDKEIIRIMIEKT